MKIWILSRISQNIVVSKEVSQSDFCFSRATLASGFRVDSRRAKVNAGGTARKLLLIL